MKMNKVNCHNVTIGSKRFFDVKGGRQTFEIRLDEEGYKEVDFIVLHEIIRGVVTGRSIQKRIGFVTTHEQRDGFVVFSLLCI